jgi:hypothetical protein
MPDIMKMKPKESDGVDSVIIVDGVPVVGTDRYGTTSSTDPDPRVHTTDFRNRIRIQIFRGSVIIVDGVPVVGTDRYHQCCVSVTF